MNHHHGAHRVRPILSGAILLALSHTTYAQEASDEPTIVVSAARSAQVVTDALQHTTLIDRATIDKSLASDVVGLLKMQAGLSITQSGAQGQVAGIRIRGGEPRHTLILIDGVPMNTLNFNTATIDQLPLSDVERIEIVRGNMSALYGSSATGGVIQIFTRKASATEQADIKFAVGSHGQRQASVQVSGGSDKVQATFGIAHEQVKAVSAGDPDMLFNPASPYSAKTTANPDKDSYKNDSANGAIRYRPNANNEFGFKFMESRGKTYYDSKYDSADAAWPYNKSKLQNLSLYANNQLTQNWKSSLQLSQYTDQYDLFYSPTGTANVRTKTREISWQNNIHTGLGEFIVGVSKMNQKIKSDTIYDNSGRNTTSVWAGYSLDKNKHHLQLNARTDKLSDFGRENTASVNYGFDVTQKIRVFAGYSNGFAAPTFNDLYYPGYTYAGVYYPASDPKLKPEHATYAQVGAQFATDNYGARVTYFDTRYRNKIGLEYGFPVNVPNAQAQGVEWHGWYNVNGWNFDSSLTYQEVKNRATGERLIRQPRILASLGVGKSWGKWNAQVNWQVQGNSLDDNGQERVKVGGYGVFNTALTYAPMSNVKIGLSVGNVFNRHYQTVYGYNSMPRNVLLSLQYQPKW